jgi:predicted type IV restriction endonuclease
MTIQVETRLREAIREVTARIRWFQDRTLGEQNTKASIIDPILEALGWDTRDPEEVQREFKPTSRDSPVDYALSILRSPRLFVEAKGLGESLADRRWVAQVLGYATVAGVVWCVLTDGDEYRIYNSTAPLDADEKLFRTIRLTSNNEDEAASTLSLISRSNMEGTVLEDLWNEHFVDGRVKDVIRLLFETRDRALIRLIRRRSARLTPSDIIASLRRLDIRVDAPSSVVETVAEPRRSGTPGARRQRRLEAGKKAAHTRQARGQVTLTALIAAGLLTAPARLFRKYKGQMIEAKLLPDGQVEYQGTVYPACSTAAENARATVTGRRMSTNGWVFWQFFDEKGMKCELDSVRTAFLANKQG